MSRKKGIEENSGKTYEVAEYNLIFFFTVSGFYFYEIARALRRSTAGIESAWKRLCTNATDYPNKRLYILKPLTTRQLAHLTGPVKEYIQIQWTKVKVKPSIKELSERIGLKKKDIRKFIEMNKNYWSQPHRQKLIGD